MPITLNNKQGFIINQGKPAPLDGFGTCIPENCKKLAEFWQRGWTDTCMIVSHIKRNGDGKMIKHASILNPKTNKVIDVSNGCIKMIDANEWDDHNDVKKMAKIERSQIEADDEDLEDVLVNVCNIIFESYIRGDDAWRHIVKVRPYEKGAKPNEDLIEPPPVEIFNNNWKPTRNQKGKPLCEDDSLKIVPPPYQPREPPPPAYIKKEKKPISPFRQYARAYPPNSEN
jgi:hypothetical protein